MSLSTIQALGAEGTPYTPSGQNSPAPFDPSMPLSSIPPTNLTAQAAAPAAAPSTAPQGQAPLPAPQAHAAAPSTAAAATAHAAPEEAPEIAEGVSASGLSAVLAPWPAKFLRNTSGILKRGTGVL